LEVIHTWENRDPGKTCETSRRVAQLLRYFDEKKKSTEVFCQNTSGDVTTKYLWRCDDKIPLEM